MPGRKDLTIDLEEKTSGQSSDDRRVTPRGTLNLTVTPDEKQEFKEWAVRHRFTMSDAWREAFQLLKDKYGS